MSERYQCRAKPVQDLGKGSWRYGMPLFYENGDTFLVSTRHKDRKEIVCAAQVDPETLCMCLGLYDHFERLMYEHDVVRFIRECGNPTTGMYRLVSYHEIVWDRGTAAFRLKCPGGTMKIQRGCGYQYTVYGNMLDDKELEHLVSKETVRLSQMEDGSYRG